MTLSGVFLLGVAVVVLQYGCLTVDARYNLEEKLYRAADAIGKLIEGNDTLAHIWTDHLKLLRTREKRAGTNGFHCAVPYSVRTPPSSVHDLRPEDISVIGALGDSMTSANGALATSIFGSLTHYRGRSWSIGGDANLEAGVLTLPNILRKYNPKLKGFSIGIGDRSSRGAHLNVADAGDTARELPGQAQMLIDRIRGDRTINFEMDWKLVTLFIGGNDLCDICTHPVEHSPSAYTASVKEALDILHAQLPRTFVNLVNIFDITPVAKMGTNFICMLVHAFVCSCGQNRNNDVMLKAAAGNYQRLVRELVDTRRYDTRDDFTVVVMPFFRNTEPPRMQSGAYDTSYFAPDCFHFSEKGHQASAATLWNSMIQPFSAKDTAWDKTRTIRCPEDYGRQTFPTRYN